MALVSTASAGGDAFAHAAAAAAFIGEHGALKPRVGIVLGTGLGGFAEQLTDAVAIPYAAIPHFPQSTVEGHRGQLVIGRFAGADIAVMQGRVHAYEGYTAQQVAFPVRVLAQLEVRTLVVTNAAGGICEDYTPGQLVLIRDHINLTGLNPSIGAHEPRFGERFFDMSDAYAARLRALAHSVAARQGRTLAEGVYLGLTGPSFETPAEIRAFRSMGADLVGMSTVLEVIAASQLGVAVLGFSCVTNMAAGVLAGAINHKDVMAIGARAQQELAALLAAIVPELNAAAAD